MTRDSFALALALSLALPACSRAEARSWVAQAEHANREADQRLKIGDLDGARSVLRTAAETPAPASAARDDERAVRQDLYARVATLDVQSGNVKDAVASATAGLALGRGTDPFTTNLLILRGHAFEALGDASSASADYHDALIVTETLLDHTLQGSGKDHD